MPCSEVAESYILLGLSVEKVYSAFNQLVIVVISILDSVTEKAFIEWLFAWK